MLSSKTGQLSYSYFMFLTQCYKWPAVNERIFIFFITGLLLNVILFSKSPYLTAS